jgi:hypothetical protein
VNDPSRDEVGNGNGFVHRSILDDVHHAKDGEILSSPQKTRRIHIEDHDVAPVVLLPHSAGHSVLLGEMTNARRGTNNNPNQMMSP